MMIYSLPAFSLTKTAHHKDHKKSHARITVLNGLTALAVTLTLVLAAAVPTQADGGDETTASRLSALGQSWPKLAQ